MKTKIAAAVVLYNPREDTVANILSYAGEVSLLIVVDNSENPDTSFYAPLEKIPHTRFITYNANKGIGKALNDAAELASSLSCNWMLTMDQDSSFEKSMIEKYIHTFFSLQNKEKIAAVGPVFEHLPGEGSAGKIKEVTSLITSGSLINLSIFFESGGYNEMLFIDEVDHEYCYRVKLKGYSVLQLQDIYLQHALGELVELHTFPGKKKRSKRLHSAARLYYIVRNSCYINSVYKNYFPAETKARKKDVLVRIKNNLLYGKNRTGVLSAVIRGYLDYKRGRFGK